MSSTQKAKAPKTKAKRPDTSAIKDEIGKIRSELVRTGWENTFKITSPQIMSRLGFYRKYDYNVQKMGSKIMKWSERTRPTEALSMEFVRRNTSIPVPRVHDILQKGEKTYIVMEFVQGRMLSEVWSDLTPSQKSEIVGTLREYWAELRALRPPHPGRVEAVDGTACFDHRIGDIDRMGPFDSVGAFQERLGYDLIRRSAGKYPDFQEAFRRVEGKKYRTVFTHGDFCLHNILVHNNKIVSIIDWEFAGWYPEYWEYTQGILSNFKYREFKEMLKRGDIVDRYPDELETESDLATVFNRV